MARPYQDTDSDLSSDDDTVDDDFTPNIYYSPTDSAFTQSTRYHPRPFYDLSQSDRKHVLGNSQLSADDDMPQWIRMIMTVMAAPRFRRYVPIYLFLSVVFLVTWCKVVSPQLKENAALVRSMDPRMKESVGGWFGANSLPRFDGLVMVGVVDEALVPAGVAGEGTGSRRLVVVGDVHGCKDECMLPLKHIFLLLTAESMMIRFLTYVLNNSVDKLLRKVSFDRSNGDHLILTGDMISKGPHSQAVVDLARENSASCVRGNHEDRVLLLRRALHEANELNDDWNEEEGEEEKQHQAKGNPNEHKLARELTRDQARWLETCPVVLHVGRIGDMGQVVVVHGGLVPGLDYEKQDPASVMNMRTIELGNHVPSASKRFMPWSKLFNKYQSLLYISLRKKNIPDPSSALTTVIYGHDSASSPQLKTYTKGLDTGCYKGGKLTALVIEDGGKQNLVQVKCRNHKRG